MYGPNYRGRVFNTIQEKIISRTYHYGERFPSYGRLKIRESARIVQLERQRRTLGVG
jgi:DNA-binding transcriptional regulator YhcF (GntR family)